MGTVMALFNSGMSIGLILGPLGGGIFEGIFGLDFVFKGGSLVVAGGLVAFLLLIRKARDEGVLTCPGAGTVAPSDGPRAERRTGRGEFP